MTNYPFFSQFKYIIFSASLVLCSALSAQQQPFKKQSQSDFWEKVQFGGGLGLGFGSGYTDISIAPSAIYNFNPYVALGIGAQYSYVSQKDFYTSNLYGGSLIALVNPIEQIQLSVELEQLRVNVSVEDDFNNSSNTRNFWNTGLFLGAGYRTNNVTIGGRYNVLYNENDAAYSSAFMPFVRVYF
ncbi:hypothetical protein [Flavobacterium frigidarium]|jgi:hypothetical protein|uniref:Alpha-ketoglutarate decarboxylase n=1 Tax=Flavobacterium frigidarium TaxID=99286 RepID=A0ABV4KAW1_9FLAO|nr:hypothetical protein [Flavobacterium sp.]|tara:strand:- start:6973 stop:7527 length:555 start_codon:yes stop_codon:yes gene_type:complete